jgi:hypothetical protein
MARESRNDALPSYDIYSLMRLAGLATSSMLREDRRQPAEGQEPVAQYYTGYVYADLYRSADAVAMPPMSPGRQRRYDDARLCHWEGCDLTSKHPWARSADGLRYCPAHVRPAAERWWEVLATRRRAECSERARVILADPGVAVVGIAVQHWAVSIHAESLAGDVLASATVRYPEYVERIYGPITEEQLATSVTPEEASDQVGTLTHYARVAWSYGFDMSIQCRTTLIAPDGVRVWRPDHDYGQLLTRWVGKRSSDYYDGTGKDEPRLYPQYPEYSHTNTSEPAATARIQVAQIRAGLAEMAASDGPA